LQIDSMAQSAQTFSQHALVRHFALSVYAISI
jgi:hypothetical protein